MTKNQDPEAQPYINEVDKFIANLTIDSAMGFIERHETVNINTLYSTDPPVSCSEFLLAKCKEFIRSKTENANFADKGREFWERVFISQAKIYTNIPLAASDADNALNAWKERFEK